MGSPLSTTRDPEITPSRSRELGRGPGSSCDSAGYPGSTVGHHARAQTRLRVIVCGRQGALGRHRVASSSLRCGPMHWSHRSRAGPSVQVRLRAEMRHGVAARQRPGPEDHSESELRAGTRPRVVMRLNRVPGLDGGGSLCVRPDTAASDRVWSPRSPRASPCHVVTVERKPRRPCCPARGHRASLYRKLLLRGMEPPGVAIVRCETPGATLCVLWVGDDEGEDGTSWVSLVRG